MRALHYVNSAEHDDKNVQFGFCVRERNIESIERTLFILVLNFVSSRRVLLPQKYDKNAQ